jgi:hypothetical protein
VVSRTETELLRIVNEYMDDGERERELVKEIARRGEHTLGLLGANDTAFEERPELIRDLEAIVRPNGSRPSFLIKNDRVDPRSSPLGRWGVYLDGDGGDLEKTVTCVGRINDPSLSNGGYGGTGVLVNENLILTNRHVLQQVARQQADRSWKLNAATAIDFGHEYRGRDSVRRRPLKQVVYVGRHPIDPFVADHAKLDIAAIELEPAPPADRPRHVLSVDAAPDWAGAGGPTVYVIGYPYKPQVGDYTPTLLEQLFESQFGRKRLAPGETVAARRSTAAWTAAHDATTLGGNSGSAVVRAGRPFCLMGVHYGGTKLDPAENWGHVLGLALEAPGEGGEPLAAVLERYQVVVTNRP